MKFTFNIWFADEGGEFIVENRVGIGDQKLGYVCLKCNAVQHVQLHTVRAVHFFGPSFSQTR